MRPADAQRLIGALAGVDASVGFAVFDENHRYVSVNDVLAARMGVSIADHLGRKPVEVLTPALAAHTDDMIDRVLRTGESVELDEPMLAHDHGASGSGASVHVRASWYVIDEGQGREVAMFVIDDTSQERAVSALRHSRARNARLLEVATELAQAVTLAEVTQAIDTIAHGTVGASASGIELAGRRTSAWPPGDTPISEVDRTGWPLFVHNREHAVTNYPGTEFEQFVANSGHHAWAILPLTGSSGRLGVLWFAFSEEQVFAPETCRFLRAIGHQCAVALDRANQFEQERTAAASLTEGLLPARLPQVEGLELSAYNVAGSARHAVGGDWYDALVLPSGEIVLVVGDVMGHGLPAAPGMGQLRAALRALALTDASPAAVLAGLDRLVERGDLVEMATVVYSVLDPLTGFMRIGDAGHLPLVRVPVTGEIELVDAGAGTTPIGVTEMRHGQRLQLLPGDLVVWFTDGLVESRSQALEEGADQLMRCLQENRRAPVDDVLNAVVAELGVARSTDDVTILALRWKGPAVPEMPRRGFRAVGGESVGENGK